MICKICGTEYDGEKCPRCNYQENAPLTNNLNNSGTSAPKVCPKCNRVTNGSFCGNCGTNVDEYYKAQSISAPAGYSANSYSNASSPLSQDYKATSKKTSKAPLVIGIIISLIMLIVFLLTVTVLASRLYSNIDISDFESFSYHDDNSYFSGYSDYSDFPNGISSSEYDEIELGMNYSQISSIIGGDAYTTTEDEVDGEECIVALWPAENGNSNSGVEIYFKDSDGEKIAFMINAYGDLD